MRTPIALAVILAALLPIGACRSDNHAHKGLTKHTVEVNGAYLGKWKSANGAIYDIARGSGTGAVSISVTSDPNLPRSQLRGHVIDVNGTRFSEIRVPEESSGDTKAVPIFAYARLKATSGSLEYTPLKSEWFQAAVAGNPDAKYGSAAQVSPAAGGIVVRSPETMFNLLAKAVNDPNAFGPAEILTRP